MKILNPELKDYEDFIDKLKLTRYKGGVVSFETRNHFFYDWSLNVNGIKDVTKDIREEKITTVRKTLNLKKDGSLFLDGIPTRKVKISYIKFSEFFFIYCILYRDYRNFVFYFISISFHS